MTDLTMTNAGIGAGDAMYWASRAYNAESERDALAARVCELEADKAGLINDWRNACELMNKAEAERDALRALLREARDDIACWGGYAGEYFQKKHDLAGDLARIDAALAGEKPC